jgi:hypothetical protein
MTSYYDMSARNKKGVKMKMKIIIISMGGE